jgi:NADH:ubiquinone oxidoreductase subunit 5 (subunit L)/multisubunit Na+/H+ antiporter MnhA subunit
MNTELFIANEVAALVASPLALTGALIARGMWRAKLLLFGHLATFSFALIGSFLAMSPDVVTPIIFGQGNLTIRLDFATSCLITGMALIAAVVITFSERYLGGQSNRQAFLNCLSFLSSCAACLALTDNIAVALVCWHLLSLGLWRTMVLLENSRSAAIVLRHHILSDVALFLALVLVIHSTGVVQFSQLTRALPALSSDLNILGLSLPVSVGFVASVLLVVSFSIKSALFPFHRWLLAMLDAPTPLSGLLHAGVVNVSAIVAWRMMPVLEENASVLLSWAFLAALSALVGTLCMSAQPDVKRKLVYSTVGQMGFMCLQCASGAIGAALFHLLAHGVFKCYMFLQSGSAVAEGLDKRKYGYSGAQERVIDSRAKILLVSSALIFCAASATMPLSAGWTGLTTVIAGAAILSAMPALNRINLTSLSLFWLAILTIALIAGAGISTFEALVHFIPPMNMPLLSLISVFFAIVAVGLYCARHSNLAKSVYVHSLNGFYIDEIAFAAASRFKTKQNSI